MKIYTAETGPPGTSDVAKCVQQLNKSLFAKLSILFKTAHALAKHDRPFRDLGWISILDESKGLEVGPSYRTDEKAAEFVNAIDTDSDSDSGSDIMLSC